MRERDTIAAISTAPGRGGIGIVRVSGQALGAFAEALTGSAPTPRRTALRVFRDAAGEPIDEGIAVYFAAPRSYTGEDVLELHGHGGPVVLRLLLQRCVELGARVAEPGEFTRRAFLNGKLDLAQAEGVIDLIDASTAQAARCAVRSLQGEFSARVHALDAAIVELRMLVEATLDFPEEEIDSLDREDAARRLASLRSLLDEVLRAARQGSLMREGLHVVLAGPPNVGKSSLLNRLAGEELAIVTDVPGTTRDTIRQAIDLGGVPAYIVDTAGLRESDDPVEKIGIERTWKAIDEADALVLLTDVTRSDDAARDRLVERIPPEVPRIRVINKIDLTGDTPGVDPTQDGAVVRLSARSGAGIEDLRQVLLAIAGWEGRAETAFLARERHLQALRAASEHLGRAHDQQRTVELFAEELRLAHERLAAIVGEFTADDLLGEIFSRFCIGK
ncbi:MAG TPA: tRNA uridine-5-carboxymethylaminomethyl(34) synthesis GTPase MnmE [Burkholderiales bacterium]|nr:tRNA uridine-5-carboxymethylaminomethyl(34) synthesis GTPase MnmE [Burkholderiales bacterium]